MNCTNCNFPFDFLNVSEEAWFQDLTIRFEDCSYQYKANKVLFAGRSDFFKNKLREFPSSTVTVPKCNYIMYWEDTMNLINQYFMIGKMKLNDQLLSSVIEFSLKIEHVGILNYCKAYMRKTLDAKTFPILWKIANLFNLWHTEHFIKKFVIRNFQNFISENKHLEMEFVQLKTILQSKNLIIESEENVFNAVKSWITYREVDRLQYLEELIPLFEYAFLSDEFIWDNVAPFYKSYSKENLLLNIMFLKRENLKNNRPNQMRRVYSKQSKMNYYIKNFESAVHSAEFRELTYQEIDVLTKNDELIVNSENILIEAIEIWIDFDENGRQEYFVELLRNCRWSDISIETLLLKLEQHLLSYNFTVCRLLKDALKWHLLHQERQYLTNFVSKSRSKKILIIGGDKSIEASKIEVFDPVTDKCTLFHDMNSEYNRFKSVLIGNDLLLMIACIGNITNKEMSKVRILNLKTKHIKNVASMNETRDDFTATVINGIIYVCGGSNETSFVNTVEVYDPSSNIWRTITPMLYERGYHTAVYYDDNLYVFGGWNGNNNLKSVEVFNLAEGKWKQVTSMCEAICDCSATVHNEKIFIVGNDSKKIQVFDPVNQNWSYFVELPLNIKNVPIISFGDRLFVIGADEKDIYEFNFDKNIWSKNKASLLHDRFSHNTIVVSNDLLF